MYGPYFKEPSKDPKEKATILNGHCYDCGKKNVEVLHVKNKGQYICSQCGGYETRVV